MSSRTRALRTGVLRRCLRAAVAGTIASVTVVLRTQAATLSGSLDLGYQDARQRSAGQEDVMTRIANENLDLNYEGNMLRPWLGTLNLGGTFGRTDTDRNGTDTTTTLESYRLQGKLLPYSPFPLSLYAIENHVDITGQAALADFVTSRQYGADLLLDFRDLPTMTIFHYGQETQSSLSSTRTDQTSATTGVSLTKRWQDLTALLRYEGSGYQEKVSTAEARSDRLSTSWVYRPSGAFQASLVGSLYDRTGNNPTTTIVDPLYSDRENDSANLSLLWNPGSNLNVSASANYFVDDYTGSNRRADDTRLGVSYQLTEHLTTSVSGYTIHTRVNQEQFDGSDTRAGLAYSRQGNWHGAELRGNLAGGYFTRRNEPASTGAGDTQGGFYQVGGGVQRPLRGATLTVTPYYDLSYDRNRQTMLAEAVTVSHEPGVRADGRLGGGQLTGNVSYRQTKQIDGTEITSEQWRGYLDFNRRLLQRGSMKLQAGYSRTEGRVIGDLYTTFTTEQRTDLKTHYLRGDLTVPLFSTGLMWRNSARADLRETQDGRNELTLSFESNLSHQFGVLFYELGYRGRWNDLDGAASSESLWFLRVRRPFTSRF